MKIYSLENISTFTEEEGTTLYNLFEKTIINNNSVKENMYYVPIEYSCRLDLVLKELFSDISYTEEVCVLSDIVNPFSIKQNDLIYYPNDKEKFGNLHIIDESMYNDNKYKILNINKNKDTRNSKNLPPSVNPGIKQMDVDYVKKRITIVNKFK